MVRCHQGQDVKKGSLGETAEQGQCQAKSTDYGEGYGHNEHVLVGTREARCCNIDNEDKQANKKGHKAVLPAGLGLYIRLRADGVLGKG